MYRIYLTPIGRKGLNIKNIVIIKSDKENSKVGTSKHATPVAVRPSSRTHQNFEASTYYKARIGKNAIKTKRTGYMPINICSNIEYKRHEKTQIDKEILSHAQNSKVGTSGCTPDVPTLLFCA